MVAGSPIWYVYSLGHLLTDYGPIAIFWWDTPRKMSRESFSGDVKIEYIYTRTDEQLVNVNILYIQTTGIGEEPYEKDISRWNELRKNPEMSIYYNYMKTLHISYSAF